MSDLQVFIRLAAAGLIAASMMEISTPSERISTEQAFKQCASKGWTYGRRRDEAACVDFNGEIRLVEVTP